jgi:hypothetical protein
MPSVSIRVEIRRNYCKILRIRETYENAMHVHAELVLASDEEGEGIRSVKYPSIHAQRGG